MVADRDEVTGLQSVAASAGGVRENHGVAPGQHGGARAEVLDERVLVVSMGTAADGPQAVESGRAQTGGDVAVRRAAGPR